MPHIYSFTNKKRLIGNLFSLGSEISFSNYRMLGGNFVIAFELIDLNQV